MLVHLLQRYRKSPRGYRWQKLRERFLQLLGYKLEVLAPLMLCSNRKCHLLINPETNTREKRGCDCIHITSVEEDYLFHSPIIRYTGPLGNMARSPVLIRTTASNETAHQSQNNL
jgi:hypothetical protein